MLFRSNCRHTGFLQVGLKRKIEIRRINADKQIWRPARKPLLELVANTHDLGKVAQDLDITADCQLLQRKPDIHARGFHARSANALESDIWQALLQCGNQLTAEQVAGRFTGDDAYGAFCLRISG